MHLATETLIKLLQIFSFCALLLCAAWNFEYFNTRFRPTYYSIPAIVSPKAITQKTLYKLNILMATVVQLIIELRRSKGFRCNTLCRKLKYFIHRHNYIINSMLVSRWRITYIEFYYNGVEINLLFVSCVHHCPPESFLHLNS